MMKLLLALSLCWVCAWAQCPEDGPAKLPQPTARSLLYRGQLEFTLNLFSAINQAVPDDNIFFSPFSVYHALLLAYFSSGGNTEMYLRKSLEINGDLDKLSMFAAYRSDKMSRSTNNNSDSYLFNTANKLFVDTHLRLRDCAKNLLKEEIQAMNFLEDPQMSREQINKWVSEATSKNINDLIPIDGITTATKLVLANAAYFKGVWANKFPTERTKKEAFFVSETRQTLVSFMKQKGTFHYMVSEELGAQILELPYKGNDISMYILLPPYSMKEGVTNIIANLTPERLASVVEESYMGREVLVEIPKFTMERTLPLRTVLETLDVGDLFNSSLDLTYLSEDRGIMFDDAIHKAKIQINEEGTVAAAASAVFGFRSSRPLEPTEFKANFPFVYVIYERPTASVLFMGVYRDPKK